MKVAFCNVQEFNPSIGGIERISVTLAEEFVKRNIDVLFIASIRSRYSKDYTLPAKQIFLPNSEDYTLENRKAFIKTVQEEGIDILINQNMHSPQYNKLISEVKNATAVKVVSVYHFCPEMRISANRNNIDFRFFSLKENFVLFLRYLCTCWPMRYMTLYAHRKMFKQAYEMSDRLVLLTKRFFKDFKAIGGITNTEKLAAIHNMNSFRNISLPEHKKKQIVYVGRFTAQKNPYRVLYIWEILYKKLPDWNLVMIGNGEWYQRMEEMAKKMKLPRISFTGFTNPEPYFKDSYISLNTSNYEGWGLSIVESQQYGCIPFAFNSYKAVYDIIENGKNGFIIPSFDINEYASVIEMLIKNQDMVEISKNAIVKSTSFDPKIIVSQWIKLFNSL